jgi:O-succinylbenzoic acid--CoA ligase
MSHGHWAHCVVPATRHEAHFGDRIVQCFSERPRSVHAMLERAVAQRPEAQALVFYDQRWTYRELDADVSRLAAGLAARGIAAGDRVALLMSNRPEFVVALFATQRLGAITVPVSIREQQPGLEYILGQCEARAVLYDADLEERLPAPGATPALGLRVRLPANPVAVGSAQATSADCAIPFAAADGASSEQLDYDAVLRCGRLDDVTAVGEEDCAVILYTSGTTGRPKGAMLTHLGIAHSVLHYLSCMGLDASARSILAVPASHVTGLVANICTAVGAAATTIVMAAFKAADYLRLASRERATHTILVPAMYNLCLLQPEFDEYDLSAWCVGGYGGAPMPVATIDALARKLPNLRLMNAYGATETTSPTTLMPAHLTRHNADSVGLPLPCAQVIVVDDDGREVVYGEVGEIWIGGPMVVKGYWNNPQATAGEFTAGFWHSGDLGSIDERGFVRVFDRKKDMLNRGGFKIYSVEVENLIVGIPGVIEAAVVGRSCPVLGERVHAFVYAERGAVTSEDVRAWCARHLADYKVPETVTLCDRPLPRNANGKLMKRLLRADIPEQDLAG